MANHEIAIIGAGFAGMALAVLLQNHGIQATIYEKRDEAYCSGGNIALAPNALRVLDRIGVYNNIRTHGYNYDRISFINAEGVALGSFLNGSRASYGYQALRITRTIVRDALRQQCKNRGIAIVYNKSCFGLDENNDKVTVTFKDGSKVTADIVIGADGIHSIARSHVAPDSKPPFFSGQIGISGSVEAHEVRHIPHDFGLPAMIFGGAGFFAIMPTTYDGETVGYFASVEVPDRSREEWTALGQNQEALYHLLETSFLSRDSHCPEYAREVIRNSAKSHLDLWPFSYAVPLPDWASVSRRVILVGDAAHAFPPTGGQGAAMALEDAETLAFALAESFVPPPDKSDDVESQNSLREKHVSHWNTHRHERVSRALKFTDNNRSWRTAPTNFVQKTIKEWRIWASISLSGADNGAAWLYSYGGDSIRKELC